METTWNIGDEVCWKTGYYSPPCFGVVKRLTNTQVIVECGESEYRFRAKDGKKIGEDYMGRQWLKKPTDADYAEAAISECNTLADRIRTAVSRVRGVDLSAASSLRHQLTEALSAVKSMTESKP